MLVELYTSWLFRPETAENGKKFIDIPVFEAIDTEAVMAKLAEKPISARRWQGDDVPIFDQEDSFSAVPKTTDNGPAVSARSGADCRFRDRHGAGARRSPWPRDLFDEIHVEKHDCAIGPCESKTGGIGLESITVSRNDFCPVYAAMRPDVYGLLDVGRFCPAENVADKLEEMQGVYRFTEKRRCPIGRGTCHSTSCETSAAVAGATRLTAGVPCHCCLRGEGIVSALVGLCPTGLAEESCDKE